MVSQQMWRFPGDFAEISQENALNLVDFAGKRVLSRDFLAILQEFHVESPVFVHLLLDFAVNLVEILQFCVISSDKRHL